MSAGAGAGAGAGGGGAGDADELFALLEGGAGGARGAAESLTALYGAVREPWLVRALLHYHARTASERALQLLARAPDPHAKHLLDALADQLRAADPAARRLALAALAPLVARRPAWLHRLPAHHLPRELLRAARVEREPLALVHALLALATLLPQAPALTAPHWPELAEALLRPAALEPPPSAATRAHLQLAQRALFQSLYATHPCTLLDTLRAELAAASAPGARDACEAELRPLLASVRLHPALVTGSRRLEADAARHLEEHDVVAEARRLSLREGGVVPVGAPPMPVPPPPPSSCGPAPPAPGSEPWFALADRCGAESAPHTPLPDADAAEPPEAAVEATPENTPAKETRAAFRFPADSSAVRAIGRRVETSPPAGVAAADAAGRLARVLAERRAADSPVAFAGSAAPPPPVGALRPEPRAPATAPASAEDREVRALTSRRAAAAHPAGGPEDVEPAVPRARRAARPLQRTGAAPAQRRASSCAPTPRCHRRDVAAQTVDTWPEPYEFLLDDFYRGLPDDRQTGSPCEQLDAYLRALYAGAPGASGAPGAGAAGAGAGGAGEQLALVHAALLYERWRREAHAERNRRLLGRCRQTRALELQAAALADRVADLTRDRDLLRLALDRAKQQPAPHPPAPAPPQLHHLDAALQEERRLRAAAEAALYEAECARAADADALQRARAHSFDATRHAHAVARAVRAAERRADHARTLRRDLLLAAEREARWRALAGAAAGSAAAAGGGGGGGALRAGAARAEAEAAAATARADAATARAHELDAALAARDAVLHELRRAGRVAADEHAARLRALQDKYDALRTVLRATEEAALRRQASAPTAPGPPAGPPEDEAPDDGS